MKKILKNIKFYLKKIKINNKKNKIKIFYFLFFSKFVYKDKLISYITCGNVSKETKLTEIS